MVNLLVFHQQVWIFKALYCKSHKHQGYNVHGYKNVSVRENNNNFVKKRIVCRHKKYIFLKDFSTFKKRFEQLYL